MDGIEHTVRDKVTAVPELKSGTLSALSSEEERVLQLYDRLLEIEFEIALRRASTTSAPGISAVSLSGPEGARH